MAGKKQHFIPQHFLKPFVIPDQGDHLWMFRRGKSSGVIVPRNRAAAQEYFYSRPSIDGQPTLDDLVTEYESDIRTIVDEIRLLKTGEIINSENISKIVTHLMVRSSHVRDTIREVIISFADTVQRLVSHESETSLFDLPRDVPSEPVYQMISEELTKLDVSTITGVSEKTIVDLLYIVMREKGSEIVRETLPILEELLELLGTKANEMSRSAQVSALGETMAPEERVEELSKLMWNVVPVSGDRAILPDCTSIAFNGCKWQPLWFTSVDELKVVVLPLAPDRFAVGKINSDWDVDLSKFNEDAAEASYMFFLANHNSMELERYTDELGGEMRASIANMLDSSVHEGITDLLRCGEGEDSSEDELYAAERSWNEMAINKEFQYSIIFEDFGDENLLKTVSNEINTVVMDFSGRLPISSLEGFIFALDYKAALNRPDRGIETSEDIVTTETEEFLGVGMPLAVVSDGMIKTRVVLRATVAAYLLSEDLALVEDGRRIITHMLASSAFRGLIANKFPKQVLRPVCDQFEAFLYDYASGVFEAYFCAYVSTGGEIQLEHQESMALKSLKLAIEELPNKRRGYRLDGDLEGFFHASAIMIQNVLILIAGLFGSYKACGLTIFTSSPVMRLLTEHELDQWSDLFRADLEGFHAELERWDDFTEIFFINRHFQRLLAHFGIVPDRHDGFGAYVHVPWTATDVNMYES